MKVLVFGGRRYRNVTLLNAVLSTLHAERPFTRVIHGGATGADTLGGLWAGRYGVPVDVYHAQWTKHGKGAGHRRNQRMLDEGQPDFAVGFPGGRGTANMTDKLKRAGIPLLEVTENFAEGHLLIIAKALATMTREGRESDNV